MVVSSILLDDAAMSGVLGFFAVRGMKMPYSRVILTSYVTKIMPQLFSRTGQKTGNAAQTEARQISIMASPVVVGLFQVRSCIASRVGLSEKTSRAMEHRLALQVGR